MNNFPKILFIADEIPQSINAGSIQFFRLFGAYPPDKLMVIGRKPTEGAEILNCNYYSLEFNKLDRIRTSRLSSQLTDLQSLGLCLPTLPIELIKIADDFKPDIVISLMQLITFYYPAYHYAKKKNIPFILFCHDDVEDFAKPHQLFKKQLIKLNAKIYQSAKTRICISPEMAEAWKLKYKVNGDYLYPTASDKIKGRAIEKAEHLVNKNYLTIGYAGSLAYGYREGINEIIPILEKTGTKLRIYRDEDDGILHSSAVEFAGYAPTPEETWDRIIGDCDAVILPYSIEQRFKELYSTHFPSKLAEYVNLQMPIIVNGPSYANGLKWARQHIGILTGQGADLIKIINLLLSQTNRVELVSKINLIDDFEPMLILRKFKAILESE